MICCKKMNMEDVGDMEEKTTLTKNNKSEGIKPKDGKNMLINARRYSRYYALCFSSFSKVVDLSTPT